MKRFVTAGLFTLLLGFALENAGYAQLPLDNSRPLTRPPSPPSPYQNLPNGQLYEGGRLQTPTQSVSPSATVNYSDGRTTYYYPNGTSITINRNTISPYGVYVRPGQYNGGLRPYPNTHYNY